MVKGLLQSEGRWIHALLVLGTLTVGMVLIGLVSQVLVFFSDILLILVMAWLFAFILAPLANWIERRMPVLPRVAVVGVIYGLLFVALSAIIVVIAVSVAGSLNELIQDERWLPENLPATLAPLQTWLTSVGIHVDLTEAVKQAGDALGTIAGDQVGAVANLATASLGIIGNLLMVVFLSVFILIDKDRILAFFIRLSPQRYADEVRLLQTSVSSSFGGFLRGQAIQGVVLGLVAAIGGAVLNVPYWPATAVIVAVLQMIPFFGPFVSWAPPVVAALLTGGPVVAMLIIMVAGWFVVMNIIQPRVMADSVGIHPVVVLLSVLIGLKLQGVAGAIFAVPVAAVISAFFFFYLERSPAGAPRDVASRAARRVEERQGRPVRVPTAPVVVPGGPGDLRPSPDDRTT
ncbi:MAG: AI-2E family transporter [Chloroflexi bacterium]|nr:AI-2E family transporter [Chloroflexota bacterium]